MPLVVIYDILSSNPTTLKLPDLRELLLEVCTTCLPYVNEGDVTQLTTLLPLINNHSIPCGLSPSTPCIQMTTCIQVTTWTFP